MIDKKAVDKVHSADSKAIHVDSYVFISTEIS